MPPGIAVPVGLAVLGLVSQNVQNKAAAQQNTNQQNAAVKNAHAAFQQAQQQLQSFMSSNPAPFGGAPNLARPAAYGAGGVPPPPAQPAQGATAPSRVAAPANGAPQINPMLLRALLSHMMQQQQPQRPALPNPAAM